MHAWRGLPLITIEQAPHTSSRQFDSHTTGLVLSPLALTGLRWISISALMTFMFGRYGMSNVSVYGFESGLSCRVMMNLTVFCAVIVSAIVRHAPFFLSVV